MNMQVKCASLGEKLQIMACEPKWLSKPNLCWCMLDIAHILIISVYFQLNFHKHSILVKCCFKNPRFEYELLHWSGLIIIIVDNFCTINVENEFSIFLQKIISNRTMHKNT